MGRKQRKRFYAGMVRRDREIAEPWNMASGHVRPSTWLLCRTSETVVRWLLSLLVKVLSVQSLTVRYTSMSKGHSVSQITLSHWPTSDLDTYWTQEGKLCLHNITSKCFLVQCQFALGRYIGKTDGIFTATVNTWFHNLSCTHTMTMHCQTVISKHSSKVMFCVASERWVSPLRMTNLDNHSHRGLIEGRQDEKLPIQKIIHGAYFPDRCKNVETCLILRSWTGQIHWFERFSSSKF